MWFRIETARAEPLDAAAREIRFVFEGAESRVLQREYGSDGSTVGEYRAFLNGAGARSRGVVSFGNPDASGPTRIEFACGSFELGDGAATFVVAADERRAKRARVDE